MPTLILSPRYSDDSITLRRAAIALGWDVMRLASWRCPDDFEPEEPVLFAEPLFNPAVAEQLALTVVEPPDELLVRLRQEYVRRRVALLTAAEARKLPGPMFLKPPSRKTFPARVYASGYERACRSVARRFGGGPAGSLRAGCRCNPWCRGGDRGGE
jgi:hypothetical protein